MRWVNVGSSKSANVRGRTSDFRRRRIARAGVMGLLKLGLRFELFSLRIRYGSCARAAYHSDSIYGITYICITFLIEVRPAYVISSLLERYTNKL